MRKTVKIPVLLLLAVCLLALCACAAKSAAPAGKGDDPKSEGVMTYAEYMAAGIDDPVTVEAFVQATQSWWNDSIVIYAQDADGGYFIYNAYCPQEDAAKLVPGTKLKITGYKAEWAGEIEIAEGAEFEIEAGSTFIAPATDVTALLGTDALIGHQNKLVAFRDMTVEACGDGSYMYNWDGSGAEGDDLYFNASVGGSTYSFTVESYLCDQNSEVYKAVKNLKVGDKIDLEGFLYWYEGANPHITKVTVK